MMQKMISIIAFTITLSGNSNVKSKENVYLYGSKAYALKEKSVEVSLEQAEDIVCASDLYRPFLQHFLLYRGDYVFTQLPPTHTGTLKLTEGLRVNGMTGEVSEIEPDTYPDIRIDVGSSKPLKCPQL